MKKFNVKVLSMAVTAAVASGAAGAAEQNFAAAVGGKDDQGQAAFFTVFGEGTTYDKDTGKLTFKKDSDALLLKTLELEQTINGFASGSDFITTDANGNKTVRKATNEDIEADSLKGVGLAGGLDNLAKETAAALDDQNETIEELKTAITTNGTRIAEVATGVNKLNESVAEISTKFDEVDSEISKASSELSESIEKVSEDVTAVNTRVDSLAQDTADAKAAAKAAEDKVTELSANVDSKVKEAKDAADKAVDAASKIDAVADKADKASKGVVGLTKALEAAAEQAALASAENAQALNGFVEGDEIVVTDKNGIKSIKTATQEDVENADFEGMGLKEVVTAHDETLDDLTKAVTENNEALVKTAEVVNAISADVNANKAALEEQEKANEGFNNAIASLDEDISTLKKVGLAAAEALEVNRQDIDVNKAAIETKADKADFEELAKYTADMGKNVNDIGDEVTALSDATSAAITRHDKDIVDLAQAGLKATEALEANRKDIDANKQGIVDLAKGLQLAAEAVEDNRKEIDANKAAIETKADKADFEELAKYTDNMGKKVNDIGDEVTALSDATNAAITRHDKDIVDLAQVGLKATEALEANRKDIDANKAAIAENTAKLEEQKEANEGFNNAIASLDKDIGDLASAGKAAMEALEVNRQDIDANKAAIETKADKADFEELAKYTDNMGKKVNDIGDEVTALSDAT
ncbi:outer membrane insertion C- signal, partial [Neisseria mucosa]